MIKPIKNPIIAATTTGVAKIDIRSTKILKTILKTFDFIGFLEGFYTYIM